LDVNTPERGGGDPPSDENTLVERTRSNQHNVLGEVVTMVYSVGAQCDDGPFYLTTKKREALRISNEFLLPPEKQGDKDKTKRELVDEMMNTPLGIAEGRNALLKMLLRDLQKSAVNLGIVTK
jgi:hypothetical protein